MFLRGKFQETDVHLTSEILALMAPYIFFTRFVSLSQTPFYAAKNTKVLVLSTIWSFVLYIAIIPVLLRLCGVYGFPLAISLASILTSVIMCVLLKRDRKSTRLNSSHVALSRMPSSA